MRVFIQSSDSKIRNVSCLISEIGFNTKLGNVFELTSLTPCQNGVYDLQYPEETHFLNIVPIDGHWNELAYGMKDNSVITCTRINDDLNYPWWQRLVNCHTSMHKGIGIKIGVIDIAFKPLDNFSHVNFVDDPRYLNYVLSLAGNPNSSHGQRVSNIITARGPDNYSGISYNSEVYFVDARWFDAGYSSNIEDIDHARVVDAIDILSTKYGVNLINISCGFEEPTLPDLEEAIVAAADAGTLCICAGGNSGNSKPMSPACLDTTIGVGGMGFAGVYPAGSRAGQMATKAQNNAVFGTKFAEFGEAFHDENACTGKGIDVAAPSLGITMRPLADTIMDYRGTSYASPIVTSVLACALADDEEYKTLSGRQKYDRALKILHKITVDVGLPSSKVGRGLPMLGISSSPKIESLFLRRS